MALALALTAGSVLAISAISEPAYAQKKKKKGKPEFSKEFIAAYNPVSEVMKAEEADLASIKGQVEGLVALSQSNDEKLNAGNLIYNYGARTEDPSFQLTGMEMMLESGLLEPENLGRFNFVAYELNRNLEKHEASRPYLQEAINYNFTTDTISAEMLRYEMVMTYLRNEQHREGLANLKSAIAERKAAGLTVSETWYKRGMAVGYNEEIVPEVYDFVAGWLVDYSSPVNWREGVNIARNLTDFDDAELLDLMRLSHRKDAMLEMRDFLDFLTASDPRSTPVESKQVIEKAIAKGLLSRSEDDVAETLSVAETAMAGDKTDLPLLEKDARAADASFQIVMATANAFLSYGEGAKAEEFFTKALAMPEGDQAMIYTRLGIVLADQGKYPEAIAAFAKVTGNRVAIARLWSAHVDEMQSQQGG